MSTSVFSYQRLRNNNDESSIDREINRLHTSIRWPKKIHMRKRLRMKIPSLKKFMRRKARVVMASLRKVLRRLKESQSHFGDLFAGNYLFLQVTPTPLKSSSHAVVVKRIEDRFCN
ncbi:hypothetical protein QVD17_36615 [Tagetes erecta]|uniref:Uncharacterized protein n=1 Tax=Tagetes erecta TaxID=13708 RepID=A0AAD8JWQ3_TARER|nr:hypothetical protein QVD17_36615 [Tagetes erecta]